MNKAYLKTILDNIDGEFPNSAMIYGVDENEENPAHVFVLLDDNNMYFGKQIENTEKTKFKRVDIDRIAKISFSGNNLSIQSREGIYDFFIKTDEAALRALCKEFKMIKMKEPEAHRGSIMEQDFEERQIPEKQFGGMRMDISPYGIQNKQAATQPMAEPTPAPLAKEPEGNGHIDLGVTKVYRPDDLSAIKVSDSRLPLQPEFREEPAEKIFEGLLGLSQADEEVEPEIKLEPLYNEMPVKKDEDLQVTRDLVIARPAAPTVIREEKPLTKKERKQLEDEEGLYEKKSHLLRNLLIVVVFLGVTYLTAGYVLNETGMMKVPMPVIPEALLNLINFSK